MLNEFCERSGAHENYAKRKKRKEMETALSRKKKRREKERETRGRIFLLVGQFNSGREICIRAWSLLGGRPSVLFYRLARKRS